MQDGRGSEADLPSLGPDSESDAHGVPPRPDGQSVEESSQHFAAHTLSGATRLRATAAGTSNGDVAVALDMGTTESPPNTDAGR